MSGQIIDLRGEERTLRANKTAYMVLVGMCGGLFVLSLIFALFIHQTFWTAVAIFFVPLILAVTWLHYFTVVLSKTGILYRTLFAGTVMFEWNDIHDAEMKIGYLRNEPGGMFRPPFRLVLTPKDPSRRSMVINVKLLSRTDCSELIQVLESKVAECNFPTIIHRR